MTSGPHIAHWTLSDLLSGKDGLSDLRDPHGYLVEYQGAWRELALSNPLRKGDDPAISLVLDDDVIVGRLVYYAGQYRMNGHLRRSYWFQALALEPGYRSTGIGGALLLQANKRVGSFSGAGMPSERACQIYEALGGVRLGPLPRFISVLEPAALLRRYTSSSIVASWGGLFLKPIFRFRERRSPSLPRSGRLRFHPVERFADELENVLQADTRFQMYCSVPTLNWVLGHRRYSAYEIKCEGTLCGYVLFKLANMPLAGSDPLATSRVMYLADFRLLGNDRSHREELLTFSLHLAATQRADRFETQVKGDILEDVCRSSGLLERRGNAAYVKPVREDRVAAAEAGRWLVTLGSADVILCLGKEDVAPA